MEIGIQLYTLREFCDTLDRFSQTLKTVAAIGYKNIQVSGTCPYDAFWLNDQLRQNGLTCVVTHIPADRLQNDTETVAKEHDVFHCDRIGLGYYPFREENPDESFQNYLDRYSRVAEILSRHGKQFVHHHHDYEFQNYRGKRILERLTEIFPADQLGFIVDTYWIQAAGGDPADWIERLAGRVDCLHLKDFAYGRKMAVLGEGNLNFDRIFEKAEATGVQYLLVEQDDCNGENPFDCVKGSYDYLRARGLA